MKVAQAPTDPAAFSLLREVEISRQIPEHPNVAHYQEGYRFDTSFGTFDFSLMQYYPQGNLGQYLATHTMEEAEAAAIFQQMMAGLAHLHQHRIIHRDLKPSNVLLSLTPDGALIPKITDFGLAKALIPGQSAMFTNTSPGGTVVYSSPEQLSGLDKLRPNTDLWSLGIIAYQLLTQSLPFPAATSQSLPNTQRARLIEEIQAGTLKPEVMQLPASFRDCILRCLQPDPSVRVQTVSELQEIFTRKVAGKDERKSVWAPDKRRTPSSDHTIRLPRASSTRPAAGTDFHTEPMRQEAAPVREERVVALGRRLVPVLLLLAGLLFVGWWGISRNGRQRSGPVTNAAAADSQAREAWQQLQANPSLTIIQAFQEQFSDSPLVDSAEMLLASLPLAVRRQRPGEEFPLPPMAYVRGGSFMMGTNEGQSDEAPAHEVYVDGFYIGQFEVTFSEYDAFCEATGRTKPDDFGWGRDDRRPVIDVTWKDAMAYCEWLSEVTGKRYRLPTEAEWEYAAGGGMDQRDKWPGTSTESKLGRFAWYNASGQDRTHPVGQRSPNALGLYDMGGNVWEWCLDWYAEDYYSFSPFRNPRGPSRGVRWTLRGGSWYDDAAACRIYNRVDFQPPFRGNNAGFRVVRED